MPYVPTSTYRLQFNHAFTLDDLKRIIPYLSRLGIGAVYASPIFEAVPGSTHGYDQLNPQKVNPEIGTLSQLRKVSEQLRGHGIEWIQDIVPNHMAFHPANPWVWDLLENGPYAKHRDFFDTVLADDAFFSGRLMVPFLDVPLEEVIESKRIAVCYSKDRGRFVLEFASEQWPINAAGYALIAQKDKQADTEIAQIRAAALAMTRVHSQKAYMTAWSKLRRRVSQLESNLLQRLATQINGDDDAIRRLVACQYYEPCEWQSTSFRMNYRRFFTINGLIGTNIEHDAAFEALHQLTGRLVNEGIFKGLRVDHVDGLADPFGYLHRLRKLVGTDCYLTVEKILQHGESLPSQWPVQGATGYEFLTAVNQVLTCTQNASRFARFYGRLTGNYTPPGEQVLQAKRSQLYESMAGELDNLHRFFCDHVAADLPLDINDDPLLKAAIATFVVYCPVYRWYGRAFPFTDTEAADIRDTLKKAAAAAPDLRHGLRAIEASLLVQPPDPKRAPAVGYFYRRCMQLCVSLMAKGLEDTMMYTYNRYIGLNDVGGDLERFGITAAEFHRFMQERAALHPQALNTTATHDTKRGEDVRARLQAITAIPRVWFEAVRTWVKMNSAFKVGGMPDANDEYFIYQTLWGTWPMPGELLDPYRERLKSYLIKAMREAKRHTNWNKPDETYEEATLQFVDRILKPRSPFMKHFRTLHTAWLDHGILNSLSQVVLKFTCPGIPDIYQGCEGWDLSFVDPDNRRPVDFDLRSNWLHDHAQPVRKPAGIGLQLWDDRHSGRIKCWMINTLAELRKTNPALFSEGHYCPLRVGGRYGRHVLAYARQLGENWLIAAVPLHLGAAISSNDNRIRTFDWADTYIEVPGEAPTRWREVFTGNEVTASRRLLLKDVWQGLPMAVCTASSAQPEGDKSRAAGILLPLFSLPANFGVGDLGPEAFRFADFLRSSKQRYWQLLPNSPTDATSSYSPYSAHAAMAGNPLFIGLEWFRHHGWLTEEELLRHRLADNQRVDYKRAEALKNFFFGKSFRSYLQQWDGTEDIAFENFCARESGWLDDFAAYTVLKTLNDQRPWYTWPRRYRLREPHAMSELRRGRKYELRKEKWLQYQFHLQWQVLKSYCNRSGIQLFGDLPFYMSRDAVDVWAHPELFSIDRQGNMQGSAGVPPDYFNAEGQSWGMPVYRWENHAAEAYQWWIERIRKNLEWYDVLRLDHFRAFCDYWEIPENAKNATEGNWRTGPGIAFFESLTNELGELPFIAEDLGDIHQGVYDLRDALGFYGMKVLQFAFGENAGSNEHAPHNHAPSFVVYPGTHDNNTVKGWYRNELTPDARVELQEYIGHRIGLNQVSHALCRMAYASVANIAILPFADLLKLDSSARINVPAETHGNWEWRMPARSLTLRLRSQLQKWVEIYGR